MRCVAGFHGGGDQVLPVVGDGRSEERCSLSRTKRTCFTSNPWSSSAIKLSRALSPASLRLNGGGEG